MSGGVDSSVAAALLHEQGCEVIGVTLRVVPEAHCFRTAAEDARQVAEQLGITHRVVDVIDRFEREVIAHFAQEYVAGRTPNPCIRCNLAIKFDALLEKTDEFGADFLATGHYARRVRREGRVALQRAVHRAKDQSYVLAGLSQEQLALSLFPLGECAKGETRERARTLALPTANRSESQELCFVPENDYRRFLAERIGSPAPGPILSTADEVLGQHKGLMYYTIGQRKGLGIAAPRPYYVVRLDVARNAVVVGHEEETYCTSLIARDVNWCSICAQTEPFDCLAQVRYRHRPAAATAIPTGHGLMVQFDEPQRAVTIGQWVVLFDEQDYALAAGIIDTVSLVQPGQGRRGRPVKTLGGSGTDC